LLDPIVNVDRYKDKIIYTQDFDGVKTIVSKNNYLTSVEDIDRLHIKPISTN
jgi:hypothetical protein